MSTLTKLNYLQLTVHENEQLLIVQMWISTRWMKNLIENHALHLR